MGTVNFGVPQNIVTYLKDRMGLKVFVEGGTYKGGTSIRMSNVFDQVITIENSKSIYDSTSITLADYSNIDARLGDTRQHLPEIVAKHDNLLFWLDAHWSGGATYGEEDECPILDELKIIFNSRRNSAILIDDARLFLSPPPLPHQRTKWPNLQDLVGAIPPNWDCSCVNDVFVILPASESQPYRDFQQNANTNQWKEATKPRSLVSRALAAASRAL
ncbi:hypothetical protein [Rubripirellula reticaptiva]|uniref:Uncharacterized protein n=1 Tax=Rubripirellula reticaptiva TaxID=2528013 RepID=A0A5C6F4N5_9BACT|nr:hypothetical protein [Rubripirellula reticaptiva]TWU55480.1 hypothetical protein Poly59_17790 [Rubripirellula reticaptiva]